MRKMLMALAASLLLLGATVLPAHAVDGNGIGSPTSATSSTHTVSSSSGVSAAEIPVGGGYFTKHSAAHRATFTHLLGVLVNGHKVSSGTYVTDRIDMACDDGCGAAGSLHFYNVDIDLRGSGGAILWSKDNVNVPTGGNLTWWPNRQHGKGAYWVITQGFIDNGGANRDEVFMDSWEVVPDGAGPHPAGSYCVWT